MKFDQFFFGGEIPDRASEVVLTTRLVIPESIAGVSVAGDPLELSINSIYPVEVEHEGQPTFSETRLPVAPGPALVQVLPRLKPGDNGEMRVRLRTPDQQMIPWTQLLFTTPGLRRRFDALDLAVAQLLVSQEVAASGADNVALRKAVSGLPLDLLALGEEDLDQALVRMAAALARMEDRVRALDVHVIGHSHIDMNWLWKWGDTAEVIRRDFRSILDIMDDYPEMKFSHSQPATYEVIRQSEPEMFERVVGHIGSGRWEATTLQWVEGDTNMASGEAMARQMLESVTWSRAVLGVSPTTFHAPDTFGHSGNMPQLVTQGGGQQYYHYRANPGEHDQWPVYWWVAEDGTRLLTLSTPMYNGHLTPSAIADAAVTAHRHGLPAGLLFHGMGDHGGGPARRGLDTLRRLRTTPLVPHAACSTLESYAQEVLASGVELPQHVGESSTIFEGCYTSHADAKFRNRQGENLMTTADTLAALAGVDHEELSSAAWRRVLFNQFHDILGGCAIADVYSDQAMDFRDITDSAQSIIGEALEVLESDLAPGMVAVTNPLGFDRSEPVVVDGLPAGTRALRGEGGALIPVQTSGSQSIFVARVPAFATVAYEPLDVPASDEPVRIQDGDLYIKVETAPFTVSIHRPSGALVSFIDRRDGRQLVGFGTKRPTAYPDDARIDLSLNVLQLLEEHPHIMSAWHMDQVYRETSLTRDATTRVVDSGPVRATLAVEHRLGASKITQLIHFYRDVPRVDFELDMDWREAGGADRGVPSLKVAFTARLLDAEAWFETPFAATRRPADGQESPALRWADVGGPLYGMAIVNDSKYGYDAMGSRLRLSLVRSAYSPDPGADIGAHHIRYSFVPHPGDWRTARIPEVGLGFNQPLIARLTRERKAGASLSWRPLVSNGSVIIASLKRAKTGAGTVLRLYESAGHATRVDVSGLPVGARLCETNLVEDVGRTLPSRNGRVRLGFRPFQVRTMLVQDEQLSPAESAAHK